MARCRFGKVKSGPRKGRCRKRKLSGAAARKSGGSKRRAASKGASCKYGKVKSGPRKGKCRLKRVRRRKKS